MTSKLPICPDNYKLDSSTCMCISTISDKKTLPRCPNGYHRDNKTLECVDKITGKKLTQKQKKVTTKKDTKKTPPKQNKISPKKTIKKTTPKQNKKTPPKKTKKTVPKKSKNTTIKKKKLIIVSPNKTPEEKVISNAIKTLVAKNTISPKPELLTKKDKTKIVNDIKTELIQNKSFSPEVNKRLITMRPGELSDITGCGAEEFLKRDPYVSTKNPETKVKIGTDVNGLPICASWKTKQAQKVLLDNLRAEDKIDCNKIIAPMQALSNCWFNTMFVTFFVSDKGRKFFRFLRQLMIEGKLANGKRMIGPPRLKEAFFLFNLAIEASINPTDELQDLAKVMDTNNLINAIYTGLPVKSRISYPNVKQINKANNPLAYYNDIIHFLYGPGNKQDLIIKKITINSYLDIAKTNIGSPDIIVLSIHDDAAGGPGESGTFTKRPLSFFAGNKQVNKYVLDSAVVRDTEGRHFCSTLTCNKTEMAFDGESFSRIKQMKWKDIINKNQEWTFDGSVWEGTTQQIKWNFRNGYQMLFYYRQS